MYSGTIAPLVTPLDTYGAVSERCVARLIGSIRKHVTGLVPALSSGEGWALNDEQWCRMVAATCAHCADLPVLAGIQLPDTTGVIARARHAVALRVDAVVISAPSGADVTQEAIYQHYAAVRAAVDIPLFVYNEAAISGNHIELDTLVRICQLPGVAGIKESSGDPEFTKRMVVTIPGVPVFEGWEHLLLDVPDVLGFIGPLANLDPALCNRMLVAPSVELQAEITEACHRYGVLADDWYHRVKSELRSRGILETDRVVAGHEGLP
jgi:4-hydroxy-tetrahydrodipicolinate synthase